MRPARVGIFLKIFRHKIWTNRRLKWYNIHNCWKMPEVHIAMTDEELQLKETQDESSSWAQDHPWIALFDQSSSIDETVRFSLDEMRFE